MMTFYIPRTHSAIISIPGEFLQRRGKGLLAVHYGTGQINGAVRIPWRDTGLRGCLSLSLRHLMKYLCDVSW